VDNACSQRVRANPNAPPAPHQQASKLARMQEATHPETPDERLETWCAELDPVLARLQAFELPADFPFDFTPASLARLEAIALDRFPRGTAPATPAGSFLESATAYIGEALLRAGGGDWDWDDESDLPVVRLDDILELPPISPLRLLTGAMGRRTGNELTEAYARVAVAIDRHPGWTPPKEPEPAPLPWLENWLAERERAFPDWAADAGGGWDFSPTSLDALEALIRRRLPTEGAFDDAANHDFVEGAVWYFGEVARRHKPAARWQYNRAEPGSSDVRLSPELNPWVGRPFIEQTTPDGNATVPIFDLQFAVAEGTPGYLTERLETLPG
jgi:hypothetical protein